MMTSKIPATHYITHTLIAIALTSALSACDKKTETEQPPADTPIISANAVTFPVKSLLEQRLITAPVVSSKDNTLSLPARLTWDEDHTAHITSPVAGHLTDVMVQIGAQVKANQALAHLSSPDLGAAQADVERARSELIQAERNVARNKDLASAGIIAGKDLEQAQSDLSRIRAESVRAAVKLKSLGASVNVDQRFTIKSPINGIVVARNTNPGMEWRPDTASQPLFVVSDPSYLWCWIDAPEQAIGSLHQGMQVKLHSSAWPNETFEGQIDFIEDALDPASHTLKARAKVRNTSLKLKSEMYVTAEFSNSAQDTLDIPAKAVFLKDDVKMVFVKTAAGVFTRKVITPLATGDEWVSISEGLNKGDLVVVDGALYLERLIEEDRTPQPEKSAEKTPPTPKQSTAKNANAAVTNAPATNTPVNSATVN